MGTEDKVTLAVVEQEDGKALVLPADRISSRSIAGYTPRSDVATPGRYDETQKAGNGLWATWGSADDTPTAMRLLMEQSDIVGATIGKLTEMMWGDGIYWAAEYGMAHREGLSAEINAEIESWIDRNRIETHWLPAQLADYRLVMNTFTEMWWSEDGKKIAGMAHKPAEHCRLGYQEEKTGKIPWVIFSPDFALGTSPSEERIAPIAYYDWLLQDPTEVVRGSNFIDHAYYPTPGMTYYATPWWAGLFRKDGWIQVNINIPLLINLLTANKAKLTYLIQIPVSYFVARDPEFTTYSADKMKTIIDAKTDEINSMLRNSDNYYASLVSIFQEEESTKTPYGKITIEAIADGARTDTWMPDSNVSDAKIVQGLGLHPSQMGLAPEGGKMGAGSGSDQKESFNAGNALVSVHEAIILFRLNGIVSRINGWGAKFWCGKEQHVTKDVHASGVIPPPLTNDNDKG